MIDISDLTIRAWYVEFLKAGWDSAKFNKRIETIKNLRSGKDYFGNQIDIAHWLNEDLVVITRAELEQIIKSRINGQITRGNIILQEYSKLFKIEDDDIKLAISRELTQEYDLHRDKLYSTLKVEALKKQRKNITEKRSTILEMNEAERKNLFDKAVELKILPQPKNPREEELLIANLEAFTDKLVAIL